MLENTDKEQRGKPGEQQCLAQTRGHWLPADQVSQPAPCPEAGGESLHPRQFEPYRLGTSAGTCR